MYYVYILMSSVARKYYIGSTNNLEKRLKQHNTSKKTSSFTYRHRPWRLILYREFDSEKAARINEKVVKSYKGGNAFKKILNGEVAEWSKAPHC